MSVEWANTESYKTCNFKSQTSRGGHWDLCCEGFRISHFSIKRAGISKDPSTSVHPLPHAISSLFRLHGCMAAGMLSEPPAGSRGHCGVTLCSCLFWRWEKDRAKVSSSLATRSLCLCRARWWPGPPQSRIFMENKYVLFFLMNGFGKMFSYFFLDIAWWYYQYQRGKKV